MNGPDYNLPRSRIPRQRLGAREATQSGEFIDFARQPVNKASADKACP